MLSLDTIDYLLLDYVDITPRALSGLAIKEVDEWVNKPHHELDVDQLNSRLYRLLQNQLIFAYKTRWTPINLAQDELYVQLEKKSIRAADVYIGMTSLGGELWEQKFKPDWSKCYRGGYEVGDKLNSQIIETQNESLLNRLFNIFSKYHVPLAETVVWKKLEPWQVLYWKALPLGYQVSYSFLSKKDLFSLEEDFMTMRILTTWRRQWHKDARGNWILMESEEWLKLFKK